MIEGKYFENRQASQHPSNITIKLTNRLFTIRFKLQATGNCEKKRKTVKP